jgi:phosphatidylglycerophosphate synthase
LQIWIDATMPAAGERFFNVTLLEHLLRTVAAAQGQSDSLREAAARVVGLPEARRQLESLAASRGRPTLVQVELTADSTLDRALPAKLVRTLGISWSRGSASFSERIAAVLASANGEPTIALSADSVLDLRVIERLCWRDGPGAFVAPTEQGGVALRLDGPLSPRTLAAGEREGLFGVASAALAAGELGRVDDAEFEVWIMRLRRALPPYAHRVVDAASCKRAEDAVFWSNYKGSTDFLTRYVFPPFVRWSLGPLTRYRVHPNQVTFVSIALAIAAVPAFASAHWWLGLGMAFLMSALDSVDGKLARITYTSSKKGDVLDHGLDLVHPPFWYTGWALGVAGGVASDPVVVATAVSFAVYILDRMIERLFTAATGRTIAAFAPIDVRMRTFISRRNVNLTIFTLGIAIGFPREALWAIFGWQLASAAFHLVRLVQCWSVAGDRADDGAADEAQA